MVTILVDFQKAYGKIEWGFFEKTMLKMGVDQQWVKWVRTLYIDL